MGYIAKDNGGADFAPVPEGTHLGICYMLVDIGEQESTYGIKPKIVIGWELPSETLEDGRPMSISAIYTHSLSSKAKLREILEGWRGRAFTDIELTGFDLRNIVGKPCLLSVKHNATGDRTYANVSSVSAPMKDMNVPEMANEKIIYSVDEPNPEAFEKLPEWIRNKCEARKTVTRGDESNDELNPPEFDDAIPF